MIDAKKNKKVRKKTKKKIDSKVLYDISLISRDDIYLFNEGTHFHLYKKLGSHLITSSGIKGCYFAVWAPDAERASVIGDFNGWNKSSHCLKSKENSGIWEGFIPGIEEKSLYKYHIISHHHGYSVDKKDPFSFYNQTPPLTGSIVWNLDYEWNDKRWMKNRSSKNKLDSPISIYELHLGSWMRVPEEENRYLNYRELAPRLSEYVRDMGFTHVEFMPVMEHPFYGSWGYQITGYFSPTSRYGSPQDLMYLIDYLHQKGIGVILDWVPSHFPSDEHGLSFFDGSHLFEHADKKKGLHPDWDSLIFNYGRNEVQSFLISNALFWLDIYHADGLRVDAVASMLYLDYSRKKGEWIPNKYGGNENLEAISFLRRFNEEIYKNFPDVQTIAEESTSWPMVSRPTYVGGLGFGMKWDMGWMHDMLYYMSKAPVHRKYHHDKLTFRLLYAFHENFILTLSHDEVVHGKSSLLEKMPGDDWQKSANLRLLYGYMYTQPGKKMLFMGDEFGQRSEWEHNQSLDWHLLNLPLHSGIQKFVKYLNYLYISEPSLYEFDFSPQGFEWIDCNDVQNSTISYLRKGRLTHDTIVIVCNFTPVVRYNYLVGVPFDGFWKELLNSDAKEYGGCGQGNFGGVKALSTPFHGRPFSISVTLPPLAIILFKPEQKDNLIKSQNKK